MKCFRANQSAEHRRTVGMATFHSSHGLSPLKAGHPTINDSVARIHYSLLYLFIFAPVESSGDGVGANQSLLPDKTAMAGAGLDSSDSNQSFSRGLMAASASGDGLRMAVYEGGPALNSGFNAEEEDTAVMIAEHVIVSAGEEEEPEVTEDQLMGTQSETDRGSQEAVAEGIKRETAGEKPETTQQNAEISPAPAGGEEESNSVPPAGVTVVSTVPVYSQSKSVSEQEADGSAAATREEADDSLETKEPPTLPGQFQEVFLVDPENDKWMEGVPGEQDSLLPQAKAPDSHTEPAADDTSASTETRSPKRASRKEKSRASLCCSVM